MASAGRGAAGGGGRRIGTGVACGVRGFNGCEMAALEPLAPDQRAVVSLVLQQGRSYDEIASMLGIAPDAVRARAHAGLAALAPANGLPPEITGPIADYLLGQQPPRDAEATRGLLAESAPARGWAAGVAEHLAGVAPNGLPEVPGVDEPAAAEPPDPPDSTPPADSTPEPTPPADSTPEAGSASAAAPPRASRLGGALLIGGVLVVIAVVLFLVLRGGDDGSDQTVGQEPTATPTATASAAPQAQVADEIALAGEGDAEGQMTVYLQDSTSSAVFQCYMSVRYRRLIPQHGACASLASSQRREAIPTPMSRRVRSFR